uniref:3-oxoacyl-(Acyl-carrier-protein) reductase FabG-like n=1 Tax=Hirondellea gigas TaxID=1518452 RepID=A0A2P2I4H4_9CRUS
MPNYELNQKVALITGSSSGIGRGCAEALAAEGAYVAITGRDETALLKVADKCIELGVPKDKVLVLVGDLSKEEDCERVVADTVKHFGRINILINSAGILVSGSIETVSLEQYDRQMNINTRSLFYMMKLALPHLLETKGNIVNISSITGLRAFPNLVAYNVSKAAVDQMTRSVALEVAGRGVRVNAVNPGVIITEVHKRSGMSDEQYEEFLLRSKETHALGRAGEVSEVADVVCFLASERASFMTAITLPIDGGRHAMCPR